MGELVMTKNEGRLEFLDESIRFVAENGGIMKTDEFVAKEQQAHPGMDTTSCYHKIVMARYFGLVLYNKYSSYYFLTEAGTTYSRARSQNEKIDAILKALTSVTFGRNNNAVSSDSDIEAPVVMLKAISAMGSASMTQIGLILYYMDAENKTLAEAIDTVQKLSNPTGVRQQLTANKNSKYFDVKFNKLFEELGIVSKEQNDYVLSQYVKDRHLEFINQLPEVKPIISNDEDVPVNVDSSDYKNVFSHNVYGIHIKKENDALSEDRPHICIGWSGMGDLTSIDTKEQLDAKHQEVYPELNVRSKGQNVGQIWRFIKEMSVGDYIVFADGDMCHIGCITSDYYFDTNAYPNQSDDYLNVRDVKWLKTNIKRSELSQSFHQSLMTAMSVWGLNDYKSAVYELLNGTYVKDPLETPDDNDISVVDGNQNENYTIEELGAILTEMYKTADNKTTAIHMFGLKYGEIITRNGYSAVKLVNASEIPDSYHVEVNKGTAIYKSIKDNEYGIHFADENVNVNLPNNSQKSLPEIPVRTRKTFDLNSILYGAPGTGKTYATAMYALAIVENKKLSDVTKESRTEIMGRYNKLVNEGQVVFTTFHQNYGYEDFIQGIRPDTSTNEMRFKTVNGVFKKIAETAMKSPNKDFVIIIDEINRANISKVFGELITLIEDDKRWGEENAVSVTLPSGEIFAVPNNLYIVGTMNSADKSISLIDTALRRRFEFIEFVPDLSLVADENLRKVLEKLNKGISTELNSTDLLVGHSYFINKDATDICSIMNRNIIPLLYEYFFDNKNKVEAQLKTCLEDLNVEIVPNSMGRVKIQNKEV